MLSFSDPRSKRTLLLRLVIAVSFGLISGVLFSAATYFFDEMSGVYRAAGEWDVVLLFLKNVTNGLVLGSVVAFAVAEMFTAILSGSDHGTARKTALFFRILLGAVCLTPVLILFLSNLYWFPKILSRQGVFYSAGIGFFSLVTAIVYHLYYSRKVAQNRFGAVRMPLVVLLALMAGLSGIAHMQQQAHTQDGTNVIVILVDALRSDHLGCYGYDLPTSPTLDEFAGESLIFTKSFSQSTHTKPSTASLFTSLYPSQHNVLLGNRRDAAGNFYSDVLDESFKTMAEYLTDAGFNSAGFLDQGQLHSYMGFAQGFTYYNSYLKGAEQVNGDFFRWLPANKHRKFFAYLHYLDVHAPYAPPPEYKAMFVKGTSDLVIPGQVADWRKFKKTFDDIKGQLVDSDIDQLKALYDAEIRAFDAQMAVLFQRLKDAGVYENSIIIVTADHGDSFMEHNEIDHGTTLYDEVLRVPLLVRFPKGEHAGQVDTPVQTIDVLPTILDFFDINMEGDLLMGQSLLALTDDSHEFLEKPVFSERLHLLSIRKGKYKLIYNTNEEIGELYDLQADPDEQENILADSQQAERAQSMKAELLSWADGIKEIRPAPTGVPLDKKTVDKLKTLGYIR